MKAHPILLQRKYYKVILLLAKTKNISLEAALTLFYASPVYMQMREGISDMHCRSEICLVQEITSTDNT